MLYPLWTAKSGSGCSVTSLALALHVARKHRADVLLVDLDGDLAVAAAVSDRPEGVTDWLAAPDAPDHALERLELRLAPHLSLLPRGAAHAWSEPRAEALVGLLRSESRPVIVDVSTVEPHAGSAMQRLRRTLASGDPSLLVTRPCYLAVRRAEALTVNPTGVVLVREQGRTLDRFVVAQTIGAPVVAVIDHDPAVARAVDGGVMVRRPPRPLRRQVDALVR